MVKKTSALAKKNKVKKINKTLDANLTIKKVIEKKLKEDTP